MDDAAVQELVAAAQRGDPDAFGRIFDLYHRPLYRYIASRVGRPSDAEDLTQVVFVKALEALPRYEPRGAPFGGWLFKLARNTVIDFIRSQRPEVDLEAIEGRPDVTVDPDERLASEQELAALRVALGRLTPDQREAIALRYFAGLSAREAAVAMGRQEGTIRGLTFRAIAALRRELAGMGEPHEPGRSGDRPRVAPDSDEERERQRP
jgi:RNA polymerase sigma-70 factor (ECF subfamily)